MTKTCGIYKITSPSGKIYIGQSVWIERRIPEYKKMKTSVQWKIFNSIQKYGFSKHTFEIECLCPREELDRWEVFFILLYNSYRGSKGLNLTPGGSEYGAAICRMAKESQPLLTVYALSPTGEIIKFKNAFECAKALSFNLQNIRRSCRLTRIHKGYSFSYIGDFSIPFKGAKQRSDRKPVYVKDLSGEITRYDSMIECCKLLNIWSSRLAHQIRTGRMFRGQYYFSHDPECTPVIDTYHKVIKTVYAKNIQGTMTKYSSFVNCAKALGVNANTITESIKHNRWSRKGYCFSRTPFTETTQISPSRPYPH